MTVIITLHPFFSDSIKQIEEKSNQIAGVGGNRRAVDRPRGIAHERPLHEKLDAHGDEHGERGAFRLPHARQAGGERIQPRERRCGDGRKAEERDERFRLPRRQRRIQERDNGAREDEQPHRAGRGKRDGDEHGKRGAAARLLFLPARGARRHGRHGRRHQTVAHRRGQSDEGSRAPREQPVQRDRLRRMAGQKPHDDDAVQHMRERQERGGSHDGQGGKEHTHVRGAAHGKPLSQAYAPLSVGARDKEYKGEQLGDGHGEQRRLRGADGIARKTRSERQSRPRLDDLFHDLRERRGEHIALSLIIPPQHRDERDKQDGGREGEIAPDKPAVALPAGDGGRKQAHEHSPQKSRDCKQPQRGFQRAVVLARRPLRGDRPRERRRHARRGKGEHEAEERIRHLIQPHAVPAQKIGERDTVERADPLCDESAEADDGDVSEKYCVLHYVRARRKTPSPLFRSARAAICAPLTPCVCTRIHASKIAFCASALNLRIPALLQKSEPPRAILLRNSGGEKNRMQSAANIGFF